MQTSRYPRCSESPAYLGTDSLEQRGTVQHGSGKSLLCTRWCDVHFAFFLNKLELTIEQVSKTFAVMSLNKLEWRRSPDRRNHPRYRTHLTFRVEIELANDTITKVQFKEGGFVIPL
jgi:hypothetical protein